MKKKFMPAFQGLFQALSDRGVQIQCVLGLLTILFGIFLPFRYVEWLVVIVLIGLVIGLEIMNASIEHLCDLYSTEYHPLIKKIKDYSAASVLVVSISALVVAICIVINHFIK